MTTQALQQAKEALIKGYKDGIYTPKQFAEALDALAALATVSDAQPIGWIRPEVAATLKDQRTASDAEAVVLRKGRGIFHTLAIYDHSAPNVSSDASPSPSVQPSDKQMEKARDAVAEALGDAYDCTRVWSGWRYQTMTQDDFSLVSEDSDRVAEITDAAIKAILSNQPAQPISSDAQPVACGGRENCSRFPFCGCGAEPAFPERDPSKPAEQQGLFRKFDVRRVDGSDRPGGKHCGCRYYVLDLDHDKYAPAAMRAYATACKQTHPNLAAELESEFVASLAPDVRPYDSPESFKKVVNGMYSAPDAESLLRKLVDTYFNNNCGENVHNLMDSARVRLANQAQPASAQGVSEPVRITPEEMGALKRFEETTLDGEGYDVPKLMMARLAEIGLIRRIKANYYMFTEFGNAILASRPAAPVQPQEPTLPEMPQPLYRHPKLGEMFDRLQMHFYAVKHAEGMAKLLDAAKAVQAAPSVPNEWKLMPLNLDAKMTIAALRASETNFNPITAIYQALLAAAPAPSVSAEGSAQHLKPVVWRRATRHSWEYRYTAPTALTRGEGWQALCLVPDEPADTIVSVSADAKKAERLNFVIEQETTWYPGYYGGTWQKDKSRGTLCYGKERKEAEGATMCEAIDAAIAAIAAQSKQEGGAA